MDEPAVILERAISEFVTRLVDNNPLGAEIAVREVFAVATIFPEVARSVGIGPEDARA